MPYYPLEALRQPVTRKAAPFRFRSSPLYGDFGWVMTNYERYVEDGFERNAVIYEAIMYKVRAISQAPIRLYRGDFEHKEMVELTHAAWNFWLNPNEHQSMMEFMQQAICYLNLAGNNYIFLDMDSDGTLQAMYNLRPDRVRIVVKDKALLGYIYVPDGFGNPDTAVPILPQYMLHIKYPNPGDDLEGMGYGLSPMSALAHSGDIENAITTFLHQYFSRGIAAMGAITYQGKLSDAMRERLREEWMDMHGGSGEWYKPLVLEGGIGWQSMAPPFKDLDFDVLDRRGEARQTGPFGVHGMLLGLPGAMERSTYNNMGEAEEDFWQNTFIPELRLFEVEFMRRLTTPDGVFPAFDVTDVPALLKAIIRLVTPFTELVKVGVPPVIASQTIGMNLARYPGDEISYMPLNMQPTGIRLPEATPTQPTEPEEPGGMEEPTSDNRDSLALVPTINPKWSMEERAILWKAQDTIAQTHEQNFAQAASQAFKRDQAEIGALITETVIEARNLKASINWLTALPAIKDWLRASTQENWRFTFLPVQVGLVGDVADFWAVEMGLGFDIPNVEAMSWFQDYTLTFAQPINETTTRNISALLTTAQNEGWSIDQMQNHLDELFQQYLTGNLTPQEFQWFTDRMPPHRTELIARTETTRMSNAGAMNLFRNWGAIGKEWLATGPPGDRPWHTDMDGKIVPVNEPFEMATGYQLNYPGDPAAPLSETANCRCSIAPALTLNQMAVVRYNLERKGYLTHETKHNGRRETIAEKTAQALLPTNGKTAPGLAAGNQTEKTH